MWRRLLPMKSHAVPNLVVAQRVIDKMTAAARRYLEDETGEALVGLIVPGTHTNGVPTIYVLDTIAPEAGQPETHTVRERYSFEHGDEAHYEIFTWLIYNWDAHREQQKADGASSVSKWDVPLRHLGDWHKQPGYMIAPSGGDLMSALDQIEDSENDFDFLLAPIVTIGHPSTTQTGTQTNFLTVPQNDGTSLRVDFWYIHREVGMFQPIHPVLYPDDQLPALPEYPWHIRGTARVEMEFARLQQDKLAYSVLIWDTDEKIPLEVVITAMRMGSSKVYLLVTPWNYPDARPQLYLAPPQNIGDGQDIYDLFEQWWHEAEKVEDPPGFEWLPEMNLVDYIHAVENALGLRPAVAAQPTATEVQPENVAVAAAGDSVESGTAEPSANSPAES
jgi:hypothetical protein